MPEEIPLSLIAKKLRSYTQGLLSFFAVKGDVEISIKNNNETICITVKVPDDSSSLFKKSSKNISALSQISYCFLTINWPEYNFELNII